MRRALLLLAFLPLLATVARGEDDATAPRRVGLVRLERDGTWYLTREQLAAAGIDAPRKAEVRRGGRAVPLADGVDGLPDGALAFGALDVATDHSRFGVFEVWALAAPRAAASASEGVPLRREVATDRVLGELGAAAPALYDAPRAVGAGPLPVWFVAYAPPGETTTFAIDGMGAAPGTLQVLEAEVYANWDGLVAMEAAWGEHDLGKVGAPSAVGGAVLRWTLPADAVPATRTSLVLRNASPPPPPAPAFDVSSRRGTLFIDRIRLVGEGGSQARWRDARPATMEPADAPADPLAAAGDARHVILATPALLEPARRLAAYRMRSGLPSAVVDVAEVYDRYGHAEASPAAIASFVAALRARPTAPLAYLLLAGDATYDRTDLIADVTLPTPMGRTMYNGATSADRLYAPRLAGHGLEPALGRLPFRTAEAMTAYVERVIRYETRPPEDGTNRMLRFLTSPGRFGALVDNMIEGTFKGIVAEGIPAGYDVQVTFANETSAYLWPPPEFAEKVLDEINAGSLFFTYVGHGFAQGFDTLRVGRERFPILHVKDAPRVRVRGNPPAMFVFACTTAMFDETTQDGIGEALMRRPDGPIAYWGATRVCHPGFNALMGIALARRMGHGTPQTRLGTILADALGDARDPTFEPFKRGGIALLAQANVARLVEDGALMYTLLGDPAVRLAFPASDLVVTAARDEEGGRVRAKVTGPLEAGARVIVTLERRRDDPKAPPHPEVEASDPEQFGWIRENHAAVNDPVVTRVEAVVTAAGAVEVDLPLLPGEARDGMVVKAWSVTGGAAHQGAARVP